MLLLDDDTRTRFKQQILSLTRDRIREAAERHFGPDRNDAATAIISSAAALKAANDDMGEMPLALHHI